MGGIESWISCNMARDARNQNGDNMRAPYEGQILDFRFEVDGHNLVQRNLSLMQSSFDMLMVGPGGH